MQEINEGLEEIFGTLNGQELAGDVSMLHGKHRQPDAKVCSHASSLHLDQHFQCMPFDKLLSVQLLITLLPQDRRKQKA